MKKIKLRKYKFKNKGAAIITLAVAILILVGICLGIWAIVRTAEKNRLTEDDLVLHQDFTITALSGSMDSKPNTLSYVKNASVCGANIIEVDLMFNSKKEPVLTDDFDARDSDTTVPLSEVFKLMKDYPEVSVMLDLKGLTNLKRIEELAEEYDMFGRLFYSGVTLGNVDYVMSQSPNIQFFIDVDLEKNKVNDEEYLSYIKNTISSAYAINLDYEKLTAEWVETITADGHRVSVYNIDDEMDFYKVLNMHVANITTIKPGELQATILDWLVG